MQIWPHQTNNFHHGENNITSKLDLFWKEDGWKVWQMFALFDMTTLWRAGEQMSSLSLILSRSYPGLVIVVPVQVGALKAWQWVDGEPGGPGARGPKRGDRLETGAGPHWPPRHLTWRGGRWKIRIFFKILTARLKRQTWFNWVVGDRFCQRVSGHGWWKGFSVRSRGCLLTIVILDPLYLSIANNTAQRQLTTANSLKRNGLKIYIFQKNIISAI